MKTTSPLAKLSTMTRLTLRSRLLLLNAVVVAALALLSAQAWRASSSQDRAQHRQLQMSESLQQGKQVDMLHDAVHADVLAALLVGQVPALSAADVQAQLSANVQALNAELLNLSKSPGLPDDLIVVVVSNLKAAQAYGLAGVNLAQKVSEQRSAAVAALPAFRQQFEELKKLFDEQNLLLGNALRAAQREAAEEAAQARQSLLWACVLTIALASAFVAFTTQSIRRRVRQLGGVAQAMADGDLSRRAGSTERDEMGELGGSIDRMAASLSQMMDSMRGDTQRATFGKHLAEALDMADRESQVAVVASRAMQEISAQHPMELLVSDSSQAQMERAAQHPQAGAPGCGVASPYDCVAVRRGSIVSFAHSDALNACDQLRGRACGAVSAVCVPVTFMGRAMGVLHAAGPVQSPLAGEQANQLGALAAQIGMRIGTVRAFEKTQIQAATDSLTGLPNRRTLEQRLHTLSNGQKDFAVVMCDLDRFKLLNDTHGHAAGDNALRLFADVLRQSLRESDVMGRWGGEEFAFVLGGTHALAAASCLRMRLTISSAALQVGKAPTFTASFGIADTSMSRRSEQLIQLADVALYHAKASGRDRACIADPSIGLDGVVRHAQPMGQGIEQGAHAAQAETVA
jgi:diguanylate cyclase (GGDEF)-like protein